MQTMRFFLLLLLGVLGGLLGMWWGLAWGTLVGALIGVFVWYFWDNKQAELVLRWLFLRRRPRMPKVSGVWLQLIEAVQREAKRLNTKISNREAELNNFLAALQESPNGVVLLDENGLIKWCNHTAMLHFGIDARRDRLQYIGNLLRDPAFIHYYLKEEYTHAVFMPGYSDNPTYPVKLQVQLHRYGAGQKLLLSQDVTALQQAETMRRDFVANVSHEIKTPLTVLGGFVETLQNTPVGPDEQAHFLALIAQQTQRLHTLVEDLLTLSKLEGSPLPNPNVWVDLDELMATCEKEARSLSQIWSKGVQTLIFQTPDTGYSLRGVATELCSAIGNLLNNAIRYTPQDGTIEACWQSDAQGSLIFSVRDNGPGIAPEHVGKLSQRFYRVDQSRSRETGGTGLGLAIVKHIAQRHNAELFIQSVEGKGSTFSLIFSASCVMHAANTSNTAANTAS